MKRIAIATVALLAAACTNQESEQRALELAPEHMTSNEAPFQKPVRYAEWGRTFESGDDEFKAAFGKMPKAGGSAFTLPYGYGFGVFPANGLNDPDAYWDSTCFGVDGSQPNYVVNRCNIPLYETATWRVINQSQLGYPFDGDYSNGDLEDWVTAGFNSVNSMVDGTPYTKTTSSGATVTLTFASYTPQNVHELYLKVRVSNSYLASSQAGPVRRYGKCTITVNTALLPNATDGEWQVFWPNVPTGDALPTRRSAIRALALKGAWQCLGRGTDFYALTWESQPHNLPGISPPSTYGYTALTNAEWDHVQPFFNNPPLMQGRWPKGWAAFGDRISYPELWESFEAD